MNDRSEGPKGRVLIVEDEAIVAMFIEDLLDISGHDVVASVTNARDAVSTALSERPDLILMDVNLDGARDGIDAAREIRESRDVPIIFITAYSDETTRGRAMAVGNVAYLLKPFRHDQLDNAISEALGGST